MRIIIHGVGAIGGVVGAALAESGQEVIGIARGTNQMNKAINKNKFVDFFVMNKMDVQTLVQNSADILFIG